MASEIQPQIRYAPPCLLQVQSLLAMSIIARGPLLVKENAAKLVWNPLRSPLSRGHRNSLLPAGSGFRRARNVGVHREVSYSPQSRLRRDLRPSLPSRVFVSPEGEREKRAELRFDSAHRPEEFEGKLRPYIRSWNKLITWWQIPRRTSLP